MNETKEQRSFETVNYLLRPKKQIERKIIIEVLQELSDKIGLSQYRYVGFGSIYYYDFILFHKYLRLNDLVSLDNKPLPRRFKFNLPYDYVSFENKDATDYLREFDWKKKILLWLDYDKPIDDDVLGDLDIVATSCGSRDILITTVDASCPQGPGSEDARNDYLKEFYDNYGGYLSEEYKDKDSFRRRFTPATLAELLQDVILNRLKESVVYRYSDIRFHMLFSFTYKDTAPMFTMGGIFLEQTDKLRNKRWSTPFICRNGRIIDIDVPVVTYREKLHMDSVIRELSEQIDRIEHERTRISSKEREQVIRKIMEDLPFEVSFPDLRKYITYYRYYPQYYEGIV